MMRDVWNRKINIFCANTCRVQSFYHFSDDHEVKKYVYNK